MDRKYYLSKTLNSKIAIFRLAIPIFCSQWVILTLVIWKYELV